MPASQRALQREQGERNGLGVESAGQGDEGDSVWSREDSSSGRVSAFRLVSQERVSERRRSRTSDEASRASLA